jgi:PhoPQ-activated pathogenicity-related protein
LIVKGANDPYWTVDALNQYWDDLHQPKWVVTVPNAGHGLGNKIQAVESIGAFARAIAGDFSLPKMRWSIGTSRGPDRSVKVSLDTNSTPFYKLKIWEADSDTLDFRKSTYKVAGELEIREGNGALASHAFPNILVKTPGAKNVAIFGEARYRVGSREFSLCSPTSVFKKTQ